MAVLVTRRPALDELIAWAYKVVPNFKLRPHTKKIFETIAPAIYGHPIRAWVCLPPRLGKTTAVLVLASYLLCHYRDDIAYVACTDRLASTKSRELRNMVLRAGFHMRRGHASVNEWVVEETGARFAAGGVLGTWIGKGYRLVIADDLIKSVKEAHSGLIREDTWIAFAVDMDSRRDQKAASGVIGIGTRMHEDDPGGRVIQGRFGEKFDVLILPAETDGVALCPELLPIDDLRKIRARSETDFHAVYMQDPRSRGEALFRDPKPESRYSLTEFMRTLTAPMRQYRWIIAVDPAATASTQADHTSVGLLAAKGMGDDMEVWLVDYLHLQVEVPDACDKIQNLRMKWANDHGVLADVAVESVGGFKSVAQLLRRLLTKVRIVEIKVSADKFTRAALAVAVSNSGRLHVPNDAPWASGFLDRIGRFNGLPGEHQDDDADMLAHGVTQLAGLPGSNRTQRMVEAARRSA